MLKTQRSNVQSPNAQRRITLDLSIVVVAYNIPRELPRTLYSLSSSYQRYINADDYEVIIVDNGSAPPIDPGHLRDIVGNFRIIRIDDASPSPANAVNRGIAEAQGEVIAVMIDGARIATPGLLHFGRHAVGLYERAVVASLGWYLGYDLQRYSAEKGYNKEVEDALLESISWREDGYRLFTISTMDESSVDGWFAPISESNALFLHRDVWNLLGGMDEQFDFPGGGIVNLDTFSRALELPNAELVLMLGEGTFHQIHGGVATNAPMTLMEKNWTKWTEQYERIRGRPYAVPRSRNPPTYIGTLPQSALARFTRAALVPVSSSPVLGIEFRRELSRELSSRFDADREIKPQKPHQSKSWQFSSSLLACKRVSRSLLSALNYRKADRRLYIESGLIDEAWYLASNPDVVKNGIRPLEHYLKFGAAEGRDPNPLFDTDWYLAQNPDVAKAGLNPLGHYLKFGAAEGRDPHPFFDTDWYLAQNPDVAKAGLNPLGHYLKFGAAEGRYPYPV